MKQKHSHSITPSSTRDPQDRPCCGKQVQTTLISCMIIFISAETKYWKAELAEDASPDLFNLRCLFKQVAARTSLRWNGSRKRRSHQDGSQQFQRSPQCWRPQGGERWNAFPDLSHTAHTPVSWFPSLGTPQPVIRHSYQLFQRNASHTLMVQAGSAGEKIFL